MTICTLGPAGTFSHELAIRLFGGTVHLMPTINRIFEEVESGGMDGLVPIENIEAGGVGATLDGLQRYRVYITAEAFLPIHHHLVAHGTLEEAEVLYSHPQTHEQCSAIIEQLGIEVVHTSSNAASALKMKENSRSAAIVSPLLVRMHGLPVIRYNIENNPHNMTRFIVISGRPGTEKETEKCSVLLDPQQDRSGLLYDLLGVFARRQINLTRIESRPSKRGMGNYIFFMDFEPCSGWKDAILELEGITPVKWLGCYAKLEVPPWT